MANVQNIMLLIYYKYIVQQCFFYNIITFVIVSTKVCEFAILFFDRFKLHWDYFKRLNNYENMFIYILKNSV